MRLLIAPDKFKGSLSAAAAAAAIERGWRSVDPKAVAEIAPIADGGEGFAEALCTALDGKWVKVPARDPLGRGVECRYAWVKSRALAIIEMAEASGLWRLQRRELSPLKANTFGTGELIRDAIQRGAKSILVGLGGSATTDGGVSMAQALGYRFLDARGNLLRTIPADLGRLARIDASDAVSMPEIIAACDVQNPLLGKRGTAAVFAPQKGATPKHVAQLEELLAHLAKVAARDLKSRHQRTPGAGAAGGIGFGLLTFCGASIRSGFDLVAETSRLDERIQAADLVITGEGRLDGQTLEGKGPAGVAQMARRRSKPVIAFAGSVAPVPAVQRTFDAAVPIVDECVSLDHAMARAAEFLERAAARTARVWRVARTL